MRRGLPPLLVLLLLVACGSGPPTARVQAPPGSDGEQVTIRYALPGWEIQRGYVSGLIQEFERRNPDVHVEVLSFEEILSLPEGQFELTKDFWQRLASSADAFQVIFAGGIDRQPVSEGLIRDLRPLMDGDAGFRADDFLPGALATAAWDGGVWALPTALDYELILYDKEAFDAAGAAYPEIGWTWDEFAASARAVTARSGDAVTRWGFVDRDFNVRPEALIELRTGPLLDEATVPPTPRFSEASAIEAVQWWLELFLEDGAIPVQAIPEVGDESASLIDQGAAAMTSNTLAAANRALRQGAGKVGVVPYPAGQPDSKTSPLSVEQVAMSAGTAHPQVAWRWLRFLSGQPPGHAGLLPARRSVAETAGFWDDLDGELAAALRFAIDHAVRPTHGDGFVAYQILREELGAVLDGEKPVEEAMQSAQARAVAALAHQAAQKPATQGAAAQEPGATAVPIAVATAAPRAGEGAVTLTFVPAGEATLDLASFRAAAGRFHQAHPDVVVQIEPPSQGGGRLVDLAGQADCFRSAPALDEPGMSSAILSLDPFLEADPALGPDDFFPVLVDPFRREGRLWGLPAGVQPYVVEYNRDLFAAAGLEVPPADWTLDDFLRLAQALTHGERDGKQYGFVGSYETLDLVMFVEQLGGRILDDAPEPAAAFDEPATIEAVRWYADLYLLYGVKPLSLLERETLIDGGRAAMWTTSFGGGGEPGAGVLPFPRGAPDAGAPLLNGTGYFISAQTAAPQACWEWIAFLTQEAGVVPGFPARRSVATSDAYRQRVGRDRAEVYLATVEGSARPSALQRMIGEPWLGAYLAWLEPAYRQIVEDGVPPREALAAAQDKADAYRACVQANGSVNDPSNDQACLRRVEGSAEP